MPIIDTHIRVVHDDGTEESLIVRASPNGIRKAMQTDGTVRLKDKTRVSAQTWKKVIISRADKGHRAFPTRGNSDYARAMFIVGEAIDGEPLCASSNYLVDRVTMALNYRDARMYVDGMIGRKVIVRSDKRGKKGFPIVYEKGRNWDADWESSHSSEQSVIVIERE